MTNMMHKDQLQKVLAEFKRLQRKTTEDLSFVRVSLFLRLMYKGHVKRAKFFTLMDEVRT